MIRYLSGAALLAFDESWYDQVEAITQAETHLLTKTRADLEPVAQDNRIHIAIDDQNGRVVGGIVLWELDRDECGTMWYELGTFFVHPEYRFSRTKLPIGDELYAGLLAQHEDKNLFGTTTNIHAIHTGQRHGMVMISFGQLPEPVRRASCICPIDKTGTSDNRHCYVKDMICRVRVSHYTWMRMGQPQRHADAFATL